jgi:DNA-binding PadR family transcriptional regulator
MKVDRFLPLKSRDYHILMALSRVDLHGYGLMKALAAESGGLLRLDPTSLYRRLKALLCDGLVEEAEAKPDDITDDPRRRYYRITRLGLAVLRAEARRMQELVRRAEDQKLVPEL